MSRPPIVQVVTQVAMQAENLHFRLRATFISKALFTVKVISFGRDSGKYHGMDLFLYGMD